MNDDEGQLPITVEMDELQNLMEIERLCEELQRQQRGNQSFIIYIDFIKDGY